MTDAIERVVRKQEDQYTQGFFKFLNRKEIELRDVLVQLEERFAQQDDKDITIRKLRKFAIELQSQGMAFFKKEAVFENNKKEFQKVLVDLRNDKEIMKDKALQKMRECKSTERLLFETKQ